jgi:hypothetical protein
MDDDDAPIDESGMTPVQAWIASVLIFLGVSVYLLVGTLCIRCILSMARSRHSRHPSSRSGGGSNDIGENRNDVETPSFHAHVKPWCTRHEHGVIVVHPDERRILGIRL